MAIYKIQHINGKLYVGSAARLSTRWSFHRKTLEVGTHHSILLQRAWNKYGKDQFVFEIIEEIFDKNMLKEREQYYIDLYDAANPEKGYNIQKKADSPLGRKVSEETKKLMSLSHKGKKLNLTNEERKIRSNRIKEFNAKRKGKPGFKHTEESKRNISIAKTGRKFGEKPQTKIHKEDIRIFILNNGFKPSHASKDYTQKCLGNYLQNYMNKSHGCFDANFVAEMINFPTWEEYKRLLKV